MVRTGAWWLAAWLVQIACRGAAPAPPIANAGGTAQASPILLVSLCPVVRTADGADVDDGGAAVEIMAEGSAPVRLARIVGGCREIGQLAHHEVGRAECHDPHVDATHVVEVLRRDPRAVIVEVFAIDDNSQGRTPIAEQQIAVERTTRVHLTLGGACTIEPEPGR